MNSLDSRLNIKHISSAVENKLANENAHRAHRMEQERIAREQAILADERSKEEIRDMQDDNTVDELLPKVYEILTQRGPAWIQRGYETVFRGTAHLLPDNLKFTTRGMKIMHRVLAMSEGTALLMSKDWSAAVERDLIEMEKKEISNAERDARRRQEEDEVIGNLRDEIVHCLKTKMMLTKDGQSRPLVRSYYGLLHYLTGKVIEFTKIRGVRVTEVVHAAMIAQINWAPNWEDKMAKTMEQARIREAEFQSKRKERRKNDNFQKKNGEASGEAVRDLTEAEERAEEERAHEYVREELEKMDPANPETNPSNEGYVVSEEEARIDMDAAAEEVCGTSEVNTSAEDTSSEENSDDHEISEDEQEDANEPLVEEVSQ